MGVTGLRSGRCFRFGTSGSVSAFGWPKGKCCWCGHEFCFHTGCQTLPNVSVSELAGKRSGCIHRVPPLALCTCGTQCAHTKLYPDGSPGLASRIVSRRMDWLEATYMEQCSRRGCFEMRWMCGHTQSRRAGCPFLWMSSVGWAVLMFIC